MKLIIAGTRPPDYIVKNVKKYAEWVALMVNNILDFDKAKNAYSLRIDFSCGGNYKRKRLYLSEVTQVISGMAYGMDHVGEIVARIAGVDVYRCPAKWDEHGKGAGMIRNKEMAEYGDELYLVWDGKSSGSMNMMETMRRKNKKVHETVMVDWALGVK